MPTSGVTALTKTAQDVIRRSYRLINVVASTQLLTTGQETDGMSVLNSMLQDWAKDGVTPWRKQTATIVPAQGQGEYTLAYRPLDIIEMRWIDSQNEIPMWELVHDEYWNLPNKDSEGTPTQFYYKRNRTDGTLYVWPTPNVVTTERLGLTYDRTIEVVTALTEEVDVPQEWFDTVEYNLAARLADEFGGKGEIVNRVIMRAENLYEKAKMFERAGDIYMHPEYAE